MWRVNSIISSTVVFVSMFFETDGLVFSFIIYQMGIAHEENEFFFTHEDFSGQF